MLSRGILDEGVIGFLASRVITSDKSAITWITDDYLQLFLKGEIHIVQIVRYFWFGNKSSFLLAVSDVSEMATAQKYHPEFVYQHFGEK